MCFCGFRDIVLVPDLSWISRVEVVAESGFFAFLSSLVGLYVFMDLDVVVVPDLS